MQKDFDNWNKIKNKLILIKQKFFVIKEKSGGAHLG